MEYFRLMQNQQQHFPIMQGLMSLPDIQKILQGEVRLLDKMTALFVQPDSENIYSPLLSRPLFLINQELRQVFQMYLPQLEYRHFCLIDNPNDKLEYYHAPCLMCSKLVTPCPLVGKYRRQQKTYGRPFHSRLGTRFGVVHIPSKTAFEGTGSD